MAVALRELEHGRRQPPPLRVVPAPVPPPTRRSVYRRRRALVVMLAVLLLIAAAVALRATSVDRSETVGRLQMTVVVSSGQTLWDIGRRYAPASRDLTSWVAHVADANGLDAQAVQPGTPVVIPVESAHVRARPLDVAAP